MISVLMVGLQVVIVLGFILFGIGAFTLNHNSRKDRYNPKHRYGQHDD